jgi:cell division protein FtsQ
MRKKILHIVLLMAGVSILLLTSAWYVKANKTFQNQAPRDTMIEIQGNGHYFITPQKIIDLLNTQKNKPLHTPGDIAELEKKLKTNPFIREAEVYITPDGKLHVSVIQIEPMAYLQYPGKSAMVDNRGEIVPLSPTAHPELPVISSKNGHIPVNKLIPLIREIYHDPELKKRVRSVVTDGGLVKIRLKGFAPAIQTNNLSGIRYKTEKIKEAIRLLKENGKERIYRTVDISYKGQIVCKKS